MRAGGEAPRYNTYIFYNIAVDKTYDAAETVFGEVVLDALGDDILKIIIIAIVVFVIVVALIVILIVVLIHRKKKRQ